MHISICFFLSDWYIPSRTNSNKHNAEKLNEQETVNIEVFYFVFRTVFRVLKVLLVASTVVFILNSWYHIILERHFSGSVFDLDSI